MPLNLFIASRNSTLLGTVRRGPASNLFEGLPSSVRRILVSLAVLLLWISVSTAPRVLAQKDAGKEQKDPDNLEFWLTRQNQHVGAAAELVLAQNPITTVA